MRKESLFIMKSTEKEKTVYFRDFFTRYQSAIAMIIGLTVIVYLGMYNMAKNTSLRIVGDEFGYWTAGATFVGIDWKSVASYNGYFGYGYGIILAPILKLGVSQTLKYQIAIGANIFMLACIYTLIYRTLKNTKCQPIQAMFIALVSTLYSGNLVYTQFTMAETFILFLYTLLTMSFIAYIKKQKVAYAILLLIIIAILLAAHKRTIALVPVLVLFFISLNLKRKNYRALAAFVLSAILLAASYYVLTKLYQAAIHLNNPSKNQLSGQIGKIKELFTAEGVVKFFIGFLGKTAYSGLASFSIIFVAAIRVVKNTYTEKKAGKIRIITILGLYLLFNLFAMEAISAAFLLNFSGRSDFLTYGRYHDFTISVLIAYELYIGLVKREKLNFLQILFSVFSSVASIFFTIYILPPQNSDGHISVNCPGISLFLERRELLFVLLLINIFVLCIYAILNANLYSLSEKGKNKSKACVVACILSALFVYMAFTSLNSTYSWSVEGCANEEKLAKQIQQDQSIEKIYYYVPDDEYIIEHMQFLLIEKPIICFTDKNILSSLGDNDIVLTTHDSQLISGHYLDEYKIWGSSSYVKAWRSNKTETDLLKKNNLEGVIDYTNINIYEDRIGFTGNGSISLQTNTSAPFTCFSFEMDLCVQDQASFGKADVLNKYVYWQNEMSIIFGLKEKMSFIGITNDGVNSFSSWFDNSLINDGNDHHVYYQFNRGKGILEIDGVKVISTTYPFTTMYNSPDTLLSLGEGLTGWIKNFTYSFETISDQ